MKKQLQEAATLDPSEPRPMRPAELAQAIIADCEGNAQAAVLALVRINSALMIELEALTRMRAGPRDGHAH